MDKAEQKRQKFQKRRSTPFTDGWRRLKKNKLAMVGLVIIIVYAVIAIFPSLFTSYSYVTQDYTSLFAPLSRDHLFGTDNLGRDIFTRVIYAARASLGISLLSVAVSLFFGGVLGSIAAFYGGKADDIIMRFIDILQSIPGTLLAITLAMALGKTVVSLMLALGISTIPPYAKVVRAAVLTAKDRQFVEVSKCLGANDRWLITRHMIPNSLGPIIVQTTFGIAAAILMISSLSYIGLGIQPPTPEWGSMLSDGKQFLQMGTAWPMTVIPGLAILIVSFALNVLGDGLRDAFDPRLK
ncbi:MAG: ABC transporter permease [Lachnospiraceae bacterium]|nr:ABC transporter permease [Lachnospiraceae bacterium]